MSAAVGSQSLLITVKGIEGYCKQANINEFEPYIENQ